jgi:transcriptional regulator with XRE-family HTH domain
MRTEGWEKQLVELNDASMAFHVARGTAKNVHGWLRTVRRLVGIPAMEAAGRIGVKKREIFRTESREERGLIEMQTLRRAAEALGCELVYGLVPKEGTLAAMAAGVEAGREQRQVEGRARKRQRAKERRIEAARVRWNAHEQERLAAQWEKYWKRWGQTRSPAARQRIPKPGQEVRFWKHAIRKALVRVMRKEGSRVR